MAQSYKIIAVGSKGDNAPREWQGKYGANIDYKLKLEGQDGIVVLTQKPDSKPPVEGQELLGTIESTQYGYRFKKERQQNFGSPKGNFAQPKDEEAIARSVSLKAAVDNLGMTAKPEEVIQVAEQFLAWLKERSTASTQDEPHYETADDF